jgi:Peptidase A4 family
MKLRALLIPAALAAATALGMTAPAASAAPAATAAPAAVAPGIHYSRDYSGHVTVPDPGTASSLDYITATWTVPPAYFCNTLSTTSASFWAGLGGIGGPVLMQAGMDADCIVGVRHYQIWWEEYLFGVSPGSEPPATYGEDVSPGDVITATIAYEGSGIYTMRVDVNGSEQLLATESGPSGYPADAEVIVETATDPVTHKQMLPLTDFGTLTFTDAHFNYASGGDHYTTHVWETRNASSGNLPETSVARTVGTWTVQWQRAGCNDSSCTG